MMENRESTQDLPTVTCTSMVPNVDVALHDNLLTVNPLTVTETDKEQPEEKFDPNNLIFSTNATIRSSGADPLYTLHTGLIVNRGLVFPITDVNGQLTLGTLNTSPDNPHGASLLSTYLLQGNDNPTEIATPVLHQNTHISVVPPGGQTPELLPVDASSSLTASDKAPMTVEIINGQTVPIVITPMVTPIKSSSPKRKGGWPKGKKRKKEEVIKLPKAPATAYVLYVTKRRQELKLSDPELTFVEATRLMGMEWSSMVTESKEKYVEQAQEEKKRYAEELKEYQTSDAYQMFIKEKRLKDGLSTSNVDNSCTSTDIDLLVDDSLHCKTCDMYFTSQHNMKEHLFGRQHLQNLTNDFQQDLQKKEADKVKERLLIMDSEAVALGLSPVHQGEESSISASCINCTNHISCVCGGEEFGISAFIQLFMEKQNDIEFELQELRRYAHEVQGQHEMLVEKIHFYKEEETRILQELETFKKIGAALSAQIDGLKIVPHLFELSNF